MLDISDPPLLHRGPPKAWREWGGREAGEEGKNERGSGEGDAIEAGRGSRGKERSHLNVH